MSISTHGVGSPSPSIAFTTRPKSTNTSVGASCYPAGSRPRSPSSGPRTRRFIRVHDQPRRVDERVQPHCASGHGPGPRPSSRRPTPRTFPRSRHPEERSSSTASRSSPFFAGSPGSARRGPELLQRGDGARPREDVYPFEDARVVIRASPVVEPRGRAGIAGKDGDSPPRLRAPRACAPASQTPYFSKATERRRRQAQVPSLPDAYPPPGAQDVPVPHVIRAEHPRFDALVVRHAVERGAGRSHREPAVAAAVVGEHPHAASIARLRQPVAFGIS